MLLFSRDKKLPWLSIVSILSMVALLCFQGYWLYNGYRDSYAKFIATAKAALQEACDKEQAIQKEAVTQQLNKIQTSSVRSIQIIRKDTLSNLQLKMDTLTPSSAITYINMKEIEGIDLERLDSLFRQSLAEKGVVVNFMLEVRQIKTNTVRTYGEHKKSEVIVEANNIQLTTFSTNQLNDTIANRNGRMILNMSMNIDLNKEHITAYLQFTPLTIFRQMVWTLLASVLLFGVILYCLLSQLRVIRQQKTAARMKNDFIANFTHELKTPIAVVYAALDNIERNPGQTATAVEAGKAQLKRLSDSVEKILSLSVEEQGRLELHREETLLYDWLPSLIEPFQLRAGKDVTFELSIVPADIKATIDKLHFANALNNIIDNAIKYSGEQVHIVICCKQTPQGVRITIGDNGAGIVEENLKRIFERFYRVKQTADNVKGFGLGLNYAKTIVELHGGTITVESTPGKGSTFIIEL